MIAQQPEMTSPSFPSTQQYTFGKDDFQAKQYLISLRDHYTPEDSIKDLIKERLDKTIARENTQTTERYSIFTDEYF